MGQIALALLSLIGTFGQGNNLPSAFLSEPSALAFQPVKLSWAYVAAFPRSPDFPTENGFCSTIVGGTDAWVTKLSGDGWAFEYSTFLGGTLHDQANAITVDSGSLFGNLFVREVIQKLLEPGFLRNFF
ncbi:MAG: hypothetical protein ACE5EK_06320 [Nitrospinales bacterium]